MTPEKLTESILQRASDSPRFFVAIAGPPASGKTTICEQLETLLLKKTSASILSMDGFHFDNAILKANGLFEHKGAPNTFDVASLQLYLNGLSQQTDPIAVPVFDRENDLARGSAKLVQPGDHIILVEGNYLLCDTDPWNKLQPYFNLTINLSTPLETLEQRLLQRWRDHKHTEEQAEERTYGNDLPNAEYVVKHSIKADITIGD